jgi:hypothetical protein
VRVFSNVYSVDPGAIGRIVNVEADLEKGTVSVDGRLLARHERRWARHQIFTDPGHVDKAASYRQIHRSVKAGRSTVVEERDLSIYDKLFGVAIRRCPRALRGRTVNGAVKDIEYYARAQRAPRITDGYRTLGDRAREAGWSHEEYLAAVLSREVAEREASGATLRIRATRFPGHKMLEEFNFNHQLAADRNFVAHLGTRVFLEEAKNVVLLGPPGTGKTHLAVGIGIRAAHAGHRVLFDTATGWVPRLAEAHNRGRLPQELAKLRR